MNELASTGAGAVGPVPGTERITAIDTLRGVAVLGILVMNIYAFAMPFPAYSNPLLMGGTEPWNLGTWFATHILADQKFMTIFSMLFGAGLIIMWERAQARDARFGPIYYRRQFWLLVIGALHAYFIWFGDILFSYAATGMLMFLFRKMRPRTLIIVACVMLPVPLLTAQLNGVYINKMQTEIVEIEAAVAAGDELSDEQIATQEEWDAMAAFLAPNEETVREDVEAYLGTYSDAVSHRTPFVLVMQTSSLLFFLIWRVGGLMLLGMAFVKLGILTGKRDRAYYKKMMGIGYGLGLPLTIWSAYDLNAHGFDALYAFQTGIVWNYIGSILVACGHIALVMLIVKNDVMPKLMARFTAVGRMALTNYLMHSVVLTSIFYGYGLGLYGDIPRLAQMGFVVAMLGIQLWLSPIWLHRYRFGPAEWLWRTLTYLKTQPMKRQ